MFFPSTYSYAPLRVGTARGYSTRRKILKTWKRGYSTRRSLRVFRGIASRSAGPARGDLPFSVLAIRSLARKNKPAPRSRSGHRAESKLERKVPSLVSRPAKTTPLHPSALLTYCFGFGPSACPAAARPSSMRRVGQRRTTAGAKKTSRLPRRRYCTGVFIAAIQWKNKVLWLQHANYCNYSTYMYM